MQSAPLVFLRRSAEDSDRPLAGKTASDFGGTHAAGNHGVYVLPRSTLPSRPRAQRLASTIARMPARTAGGRLDHALTT